MSSSGGSYGEYRPPRGEPVVQYHVGENPPQQYNIHTKEWQVPREYLGSEGARGGGHTHGRIYLSNFLDVGIFKDTLAPSLAIHSGLAVVAWGIGRQLDYVEAKDCLWSGGLLINAWWSAVGRRVLLKGVPAASVLRTISWPERLLLTGVTVWGSRLFYRVVSRGVRRGKDDPRYDTMKKEDGFWNKALVQLFLAEAVVQSIIALPFTAPFRHEGGVMTGYHPIVQSLAVGLFCTGFALEALADYQLAAHKSNGDQGLLREGVWSIVRHPNYLGDALVHASFPLLLFASDMLAPIELLGPLANYYFLRYIAGDKENEASQAERYQRTDPLKKKQFDEYRTTKNSFWPTADELKNQWTWIVVGTGVVGIVLERGIRAALH